MTVLNDNGNRVVAILTGERHVRVGNRQTAGKGKKAGAGEFDRLRTSIKPVTYEFI